MSPEDAGERRRAIRRTADTQGTRILRIGGMSEPIEKNGPVNERDAPGCVIGQVLVRELEAGRQRALELLCIMDGMAIAIVVEVSPYPERSAGLDPVRPRGELLVGVIMAIPLLFPM